MSATATLPAGPSRRPPAARFNSRNPDRSNFPNRPAPKSDQPAKKEHDILFQKFFKSVGPRTYAAQVKRASNGNHYLVLMEGKRDEKSAEVRKTRLFIYSEDFVEFFRLVKSTAEFIRDHPVPEEVRRKQEKRWAKQAGNAPRRN
jgi:hypothetical protein